MNKGSDAHQIVCKFIEASGVGKTNFPRHMAQAKRLLDSYKLEDILYALDVYGKKMYSLGFLTEDKILSARGKRLQEEVASEQLVTRGEDVAERNKARLQRIHHKSRLRERDFEYLLGEQPENN